MRCMLRIQCAVRGLLTVNGQFCGPVEGDGQTFPAAQDAEIFIEYMPLVENAGPLALELVLENGRIARLEPAARGYALLWPDGLIQLELRPDAADTPAETESEQAAQNVLLRYLTLRLAGDAGAGALLMHPGAAEGCPLTTRWCRCALHPCARRNGLTSARGWLRGLRRTSRGWTRRWPSPCRRGRGSG